MKHRVGFIGTGDIAGIHAEAILKAQINWQIAGGYDVNKSVRDRFCKAYKATAYESAEELLQDVGIDTVYICTRHDSHVDYSIMACEMGKNVFLEKPVAMDSAGAIRLRECWEKHPVPFAVGYNMRVTPSVLDLKKTLSEHGVVPQAFRLNMTGTPFMQGWAGESAVGGGVLVCQGSHMFDLITDILGSPISEVCVETQWISQPKKLEPNGATALVKLQNGVCGTLIAHDQGNESYHVEHGGMVNITIYSQKGVFDADVYGSVRYGTAEGIFQHIPYDINEQTKSWGYENEANYFAELLETKNSPLCSLEEAVKVAEIVDAARRSAKERRWITVKDKTKTMQR